MKKVVIPALDDERILRHVRLGETGWRLLLWDTCGVIHDKPALGYSFYKEGKSPLFIGEDFGCSPLDAVDSEEAIRALLEFLTLRPGDTDAEFFRGYSPAQLQFAEQEAEYLQFWAGEFGDGPLIDV